MSPRMEVILVKSLSFRRRNIDFIAHFHPKQKENKVKNRNKNTHITNRRSSLDVAAIIKDKMTATKIPISYLIQFLDQS